MFHSYSMIRSYSRNKETKRQTIAWSTIFLLLGIGIWQHCFIGMVISIMFCMDVTLSWKDMTNMYIYVNIYLMRDCVYEKVSYSVGMRMNRMICFPIQSMLIHISTNIMQIALIRYIDSGSRKWLNIVFSETNLSHIKATFVHSIAWKLSEKPAYLSWLKNIRDIFLFYYWIVSALRFASFSSPDVIFCKWWFVALPLIIVSSPSSVSPLLYMNQICFFFYSMTYK